MEKILYNSLPNPLSNGLRGFKDSPFRGIGDFCFALLLALFACSGDSDIDALRPMAISADFGEATRATTQIPLDGSKYTMWANAVYKSNDTSSSFYSPNSYFSPNPLQLSYDASSASYVATNYFYPLDGTMRFAAYASTLTGTPNATFSYDANKKVTKLTVNLTSADGLHEVVYSDYTEVTCPATATPKLHFHRAQTNLRFKFIPADEYTCKHVIINYIEVKDVQWKGTLNVSYNSSTGKASHSWTNPAAAANYTLNIVTKGTVPDESSSTRMRWDATTKAAIPLEAGDGAHILPTTTGRTQIIVHYTMLNDPTSTSAGGVGGDVNDGLLGRTDDYKRYLTYVIDADPSENWEASTQYYYNIKVHGNAQMDVEKVAVAAITHGATGTMEI